MRVVHKAIKLESPGGQPTFHRITEAVREAIKESGIRDGICVVFSRHTTCSIITDEDSIDLSVTGLTKLQQDMVDIMESTIPTCRRENTYLHPGPQALAFAAEHTGAESVPGQQNPTLRGPAPVWPELPARPIHLPNRAEQRSAYLPKERCCGEG